MDDFYDDDDDEVTDPNFDALAQSAFDNLNDATDWSWQGLARAFARRYKQPDLMELQAALSAAILEAGE